MQCPMHQPFAGKSQEELVKAEQALVLKEGQMDKSGGSGVSKLQEGGAQAKTAGAYVPPHLRNKTGAGASVPGASGSASGSNGKLNATASPKSGASKTNNGSNAAASAKSGPSSELEKTMLQVQRKLRQIEGLKQKQSEGQTLEKNQLDKLAGEQSLKEDLAKLESQLKSLKT